MENNDNFQQNSVQVEEPFAQDADYATAMAKRRKWSKILTVLLIVAVVVLVGCLLLKWFCISNIGVSGISMMPNYESGNVVWVNKTITPCRGDVIVFYVKTVNKFKGEFARGDDVKPGGLYEKYIKRVVAVGGDKIWWEAVDDTRCILHVKTSDGKYLTENDGDNVYFRKGKQAVFYTASGGETTTVPYFQIPEQGNVLYEHNSEQNAFIVKADHFFVMGDYRFNSTDSRKIGTVWMEKLYGVVINP